MESQYASNFALFFLFNAHHEVLLLRRINTPFCNNCYSLPGGQIEKGETARQAIIREAKNSIGIELSEEHLKFVHIMYRKCNEPEFFACFFQAVQWTGKVINKELSRHDNIAWFSPYNLPENIVPAHRQALEMLLKEILYSEHGWK